MVNSTILHEKMDPSILENIDDIVTYHWDKWKKLIQHEKVVDMLKPLDSEQMDEIQH